MRHQRALAAVGLASLLLVALPASPAAAHGYVNAPPSRQADCAQGRVGDCGPIVWEPQSVEGPKGQKNCPGGLPQFAQLSDETKAWPATPVGRRVEFTWTLTARHATTTWEYFIGETRIAVFDDHGGRPAATVRHTVDLGAHTGRQKVLAVWNIADTPMAFYNCVDLDVGTSLRATDPNSRRQAGWEPGTAPSRWHRL
ncbi:lytic polysaccharide monooxygenase auxiliary activity family 9 protein [Actinokineospora iranica]|uniref:Chitin-binding protein n=1 Tax=Actinokineospora iranica TaxID=1271860 RepID=A0A1G6YT77_9PSEU|nr:lytic polysaccharide monooxygenase auxiliary activity family 9 protein [Actinokineospora iranica]SDD93568.1 chitin-binding protein [Actinokineospora iranica]